MSGIKVGEIDIGDQVLDNQFRILILTSIVSWILANNNNINKPTEADVKKFREEAIKELQQKYPKSGIKLKI